MAAGIVASRGLRDLLTRRLTASNYPGLSITLRLTGSSAQEEASGVALGEAPDHSYESLRVTSAQKHVLHVQLNRPNKRNAMNKVFWRSDLQILEACLRGEAGLARLGESGTLWEDEHEGRIFPPFCCHCFCAPASLREVRRLLGRARVLPGDAAQLAASLPERF
ncbi:delta(3,5)-Delta(2,4)-dienoyl-CoA isomerase, mitochondrial [Nomascus leucogenys]|uniref:delta(3,5)-Delta(2,4)-dienoyl-CoA isomerase, mitochondrial n=1 Tax=Nomascus leucogenys TaxID=61853 RepID=UPI00122D6FCB|nr:delta(3,5)-Delta(2,4)-dienoyl-CoA isomerase, mitochondrial [Nomascus leucogenys]